MPKTCRTPSESKESTKRSDAFLGATRAPLEWGIDRTLQPASSLSSPYPEATLQYRDFDADCRLGAWLVRCYMSPAGPLNMRRIIPLIALALLALPTAAASASTRYQTEGRGFGHGVGMSQYGADGF